MASIQASRTHQKCNKDQPTRLNKFGIKTWILPKKQYFRWRVSQVKSLSGLFINFHWDKMKMDEHEYQLCLSRSLSKTPSKWTPFRLLSGSRKIRIRKSSPRGQNTKSDIVDTRLRMNISHWTRNMSLNKQITPDIGILRQLFQLRDCGPHRTLERSQTLTEWWKRCPTKRIHWRFRAKATKQADWRTWNSQKLFLLFRQSVSPQPEPKPCRRRPRPKYFPCSYWCDAKRNLKSSRHYLGLSQLTNRNKNQIVY